MNVRSGAANETKVRILTIKKCATGDLCSAYSYLSSLIFSHRVSK